MNFCLRRLTVRTPGFHPGNGSSILPGDAIFLEAFEMRLNEET